MVGNNKMTDTNDLPLFATSSDNPLTQHCAIRFSMATTTNGSRFSSNSTVKQFSSETFD
jgi:hypothetical protein